MILDTMVFNIDAKPWIRFCDCYIEKNSETKGHIFCSALLIGCPTEIVCSVNLIY